MRTYISKTKRGLIIYNETTKQSIIEDALLIFVIATLIGLDVLFSMLISHSWILDILVLILTSIHFISRATTRFKPTNKEEIIKIVDELNDIESK